MDRIQYFLELAESDRPMTQSDKEELQMLLHDLQQRYDEGHPIVSDTEYDKLLELGIYEGEIRHSSEDNSYGKRVQHPIDIMRGTLSKVYYLTDTVERKNKSRKTLPEWIKSTQEKLTPHGIDLMKEPIVVTAKYDGMSCVLYVDSKGGCFWLTRGDTDTNEGVDISHIMKGMNVPIVPNTATQFELLVPDQCLEELNERYSTDYKNTRALTAGIIRTKEVDYRAQYITPIPLKLYQDGKLTIHPDQFTKYPSIKCTLANIDQLQSFADRNRHVLGKFRTDGIVITLINPRVQEILGRKDNINQYEVAFKFTEESGYTTVEDIEFNVSEMGTVTPVAILTPIKLKGNTVSRVSLHNKDYFDELSLKYGDVVQILYDIIPYCAMDDHCRKLNRLNKRGEIPFPTECPSCRHRLDLQQTIVSCINPSCPAIKTGRVINYLNVLNCKGIGAETVKRLSDMGVITDIPTLYHLGSVKQQKVILDSHGFGELKMKMILNEIRRIRTLDDYQFFAALGFKGLSTQFFKSFFREVKLEDFLNYFNKKDWDRLFHLVHSVSGVGPVKAELFLSSIQSDRELITRCLKWVTLRPTYGKKGVFPGVVFTQFRDDAMKQWLIEHGYDVQDNVNKYTKFVIAKDPNEETGSVKKARARDIPVYSLAEVRAKMVEGKEP